MSTITLNKVSKIYDNDFKAVDNVHLNIQDGEFIVLVGPSGCGKSTTLRMIAGLETITEGEISIGDTIVNELPPKDRDIAMVFQSYALYPHMTTRDNIAFALKLAGQNKAQRYKKVDQIARILELESVLDNKPDALSGGQKQRVALGRAMVREPQVFLLDEPLSNLDAKLRVGMRGEIVSLHRKLGTTFIYVTHDQTEAMTMGDRIAVMNKGSVEQFDTPHNLYHHPTNLFVAQFIGSPQMNIIPAILFKQNQHVFIRLNQKHIPLPRHVLDPDVLIPTEGLEIFVGIRSENIHYAGMPTSSHLNSSRKLIQQFEAPSHLAQFDISIKNVEQLGSDTFAYFDFSQDKIPLVARFNPPQVIQIDDIISVRFDTNRLLFFDRTTGLNLENALQKEEDLNEKIM